jgi:hypothetical protein
MINGHQPPAATRFKPGKSGNPAGPAPSLRSGVREVGKMPGMRHHIRETLGRILQSEPKDGAECERWLAALRLLLSLGEGRDRGSGSPF